MLKNAYRRACRCLSLTHASFRKERLMHILRAAKFKFSRIADGRHLWSCTTCTCAVLSGFKNASDAFLSRVPFRSIEKVGNLKRGIEVSIVDWLSRTVYLWVFRSVFILFRPKLIHAPFLVHGIYELLFVYQEHRNTREQHSTTTKIRLSRVE